MAFDQNAKLTFVLQAKDLASKTFKEARGNLGHLDDASKKTSKSFGGLTKLGISPMNVAFGAAALGATVLVGGLISATKAAIAEEKNIAKLNAALKANIAGFDGNTTAIEKAIAKRELLAFSDDELRDSLAKLVAATGNVDKAFTIQRTAMDLARLKGISLGDATEALTKVEAGSFRILKSLGIELKDGATQMEALAAVTAVARGQAEAYAGTVEGQMLVAQIKMDDAMEDFGRTTMPLVTEGLRVLTLALDRNAMTYEEVEAAAEKGVPAAILQLEKMRKEGVKSVKEMSYDVGVAARAAFQTLPDEAKEGARETVRVIRAMPGKLAAALRENRTTWENAWEEYKTTWKTVMTTVEQESRIHAILASKRLRAGLDDARPEVRAAAHATAQQMLDALKEMRDDAGGIGKAASAELAEHLRAGGPKVYNAGKYLGNKAEAGFKAGWGFPKLLYSVGPNKPPKAPAGKKAGGGPASGLTWVGEQGPELVSLPSGSFVHNARNSERMASGGNMTFVYAPTYSSASPAEAERFVRSLSPTLVRELQRLRKIA